MSGNFESLGQVPRTELISATHVPHKLPETASEMPLYVVGDRTIVGMSGRYEFVSKERHPNSGARMAAFNALVELLVNGDEEAVRLRTVAELTRSSADATGVAIGELRSSFKANALPWPFRHSAWGQAARIRRDENVMLCDARTQLCAPRQRLAAGAFLEAAVANPDVPQLIRTEDCRRVATFAMRTLLETTAQLREGILAFNGRVTDGLDAVFKSVS